MIYAIKRHIIILSGFFFCFTNGMFSQNSILNTDSLWSVYNKTQIDTVKFSALSKLSEYYLDINTDSAKTLIKKALKTINSIIENEDNKEFKKPYLQYKAVFIRNYGLVMENKGDYENALKYYNQSYRINRKINDQQGILATLSDIAYINYALSNIDQAIHYYHLLYKQGIKTNKKRYSATALNALGVIYSMMGDVDKSLENYRQAIKINEELKNKSGISAVYHNIADIYYKQDESKSAIEYYKKSLAIDSELVNKTGIASNYNKMGMCQEKTDNKAEALSFYNKALEIYKEQDDAIGVVSCLNNIGVFYSKQGNDEKEFEYCKEALDISRKAALKNQISLLCTNIGGIYLRKGNTNMAIQYAEEAMKIAQELGYPENIRRASRLLKDIYYKTDDFKKAFDYYVLENQMNDSVVNEENRKKTIETEARIKYEKKSLADSLEHAKQMEIKDLVISKKETEIKQRDFQRNVMIAGFLLVSVLAYFIFRSYRQKKKANIQLNLQNERIRQQKEEIESQRDEIEEQRDIATHQRDLITEQKKDITDSIEYAYMIQTAIFPHEEDIRLMLNDYFLLYKPRDIVSGDFYWINKLGDKTIVIAADCTGHGVPGAFMSMLGVAFLNEIVNKETITNPATILNRLREDIILALKQHGKRGVSKDGMDIAVITLNQKEHKLEYAGANNPLYLVRNNELIETKADKMPVSIYAKMRPFQAHEIPIQKSDALYIFSDGYADQFGGPNGKKFKYKHFKNLLIDISDKKMDEQKRILTNTFEQWKSYTNSEGQKYNQIDDVLIIGVKI